MSIDAGDKLIEYEVKQRERIGGYMYDHQEDYVSRSIYEKTVDQLTNAKELLTRFVMASVYFNGKETDLVEEAEQFISEMEK